MKTAKQKITELIKAAKVQVKRDEKWLAESTDDLEDARQNLKELLGIQDALKDTKKDIK